MRRLFSGEVDKVFVFTMIILVVSQITNVYLLFFTDYLSDFALPVIQETQAFYFSLWEN